MRAIGSLLIETWKIFKSKWVVLVLIQLLAVLTTVLSSRVFGVENFFQKEFKPSLDIFLENKLIFLGFILSVSAQTWALGASIFAIKEKKLAFNPIFKTGFVYFLTILGAGLINTLAVLAGIILLIIPGVVVAVWFSLYSYLIVDQNLGAVASLKKSTEMVKGHFWEVTNRWAVVILISFLVRLVGSILNFSILNLSIVAVLAEVLVTPLILIYGFLIYQELKLAKIKKHG